MKEDRLQRADEREEDSGQFSSLPPFSPEQGPTNSVRLNNLDLFTIATTASNTPNCLHITLSWYDTINSWVKLTPLDGRPDSSSPFLGWDWEISWAAAWRSSCRRASVSPSPGILWFLFLAESWECNKLELSVKREMIVDRPGTKPYRGCSCERRGQNCCRRGCQSCSLAEKEHCTWKLH